MLPRLVLCLSLFVPWVPALAAEAKPAPLPPQPKLAGLADNTAMDLGFTNLQGVEGESKNYANGVTDYSGFAYDQRKNRFLLFGGGHSTTFTDTIYIFTFDELKWNALYPPTPVSKMTEDNFDKENGAWKTGPAGPYPRPLSRHSYDEVCFIESTNEMIMYRTGGGGNGIAKFGSAYFSGKIPVYSFDKQAWSFFPTTHQTNTCPATEFDPVSKKMLSLGPGGFYVYDPIERKDAKINFKLPEYIRTTGWCNLVYCPINQKMYYMGREAKMPVYELTLDRNDWSKSKMEELAVTGDQPDVGESGWAYDSVNQIIGGGVKDGVFHAFDPIKRSWTRKEIQTAPSGGKIGSLAFHCLNYSPVDNVFVFITNSKSGRHTWAYRYANKKPAR